MNETKVIVDDETGRRIRPTCKVATKSLFVMAFIVTANVIWFWRARVMSASSEWKDVNSAFVVMASLVLTNIIDFVTIWATSATRQTHCEINARNEKPSQRCINVVRLVLAGALRPLAESFFLAALRYYTAGVVVIARSPWRAIAEKCAEMHAPENVDQTNGLVAGLDKDGVDDDDTDSLFDDGDFAQDDKGDKTDQLIGIGKAISVGPGGDTATSAATDDAELRARFRASSPPPPDDSRPPRKDSIELEMQKISGASDDSADKVEVGTAHAAAPHVHTDGDNCTGNGTHHGQLSKLGSPRRHNDMIGHDNKSQGKKKCRRLVRFAQNLAYILSHSPTVVLQVIVIIGVAYTASQGNSKAAWTMAGALVAALCAEVSRIWAYYIGYIHPITKMPTWKTCECQYTKHRTRLLQETCVYIFMYMIIALWWDMGSSIPSNWSWTLSGVALMTLSMSIDRSRARTRPKFIMDCAIALVLVILEITSPAFMQTPSKVTQTVWPWSAILASISCALVTRLVIILETPANAKSGIAEWLL